MIELRPLHSDWFNNLCQGGYASAIVGLSVSRITQKGVNEV